MSGNFQEGNQPPIASDEAHGDLTAEGPSDQQRVEADQQTSEESAAEGRQRRQVGEPVRPSQWRSQATKKMETIIKKVHLPTSP
jgi:hypothetical protein